MIKYTQPDFFGTLSGEVKPEAPVRTEPHPTRSFALLGAIGVGLAESDIWPLQGDPFFGCGFPGLKPWAESYSPSGA
jgi:hypothetical protein